MTKIDFRLLYIIYGSILFLGLAPFLGITLIKPFEIFNETSPENLVFWQIRLPRCLGAFLAGAGLSLCGLVFQTLFLNPLATPFTLGISSGAALGSSIYVRFGVLFSIFDMTGALPFALTGCALSMLAVYIIARAVGNMNVPIMLLAGVIINFFFSSLVMFVQYASNAQDAIQIMRWLMGTLSGVSQTALWQMFIILVMGYYVFTRISLELDLLLTGDEIALSRGVNVYYLKLIIFIAASFITGIIVSITGPIGFVGMIIPQICRFIFGYSHRSLIPASFFLGGAFLTGGDVLARTILAPAELPIGIITSMLGAPFFLWILFRNANSSNQI